MGPNSEPFKKKLYIDNELFHPSTNPFIFKGPHYSIYNLVGDHVGSEMGRLLGVHFRDFFCSSWGFPQCRISTDGFFLFKVPTSKEPSK